MGISIRECVETRAENHILLHSSPYSPRELILREPASRYQECAKVPRDAAIMSAPLGL